MLQTIHDKLKGIFAIAILAALGVVFVFWGVNVGVGDFTRARGIEVNGREIAVEEVQRAYQDELSRYQVALGTDDVPDEVRKAIRERVLDQAIGTELVRQRTRKLDFETSDQEVLATIREVPAFQVAGEFSPDAYHAALRSINMTPERFELEQREFVLARQLDRGLSASAFVLPGEVERDVSLRREARTIGWVTIPSARFTSEAAPDEAAIKAYYDAHKARYTTEEQANVQFIELKIDDFAAQVSVDEEQLRAYYEEIKGRYTQPGRRRARHILFEEGDDPAAAEAEAEAKRAYERAKSGEDFAALARELSDDAGSREAGGDIGFAERNDLDPAFADALWGMKPGEIRGPVKSAFGWHVIKLEAAEPEVVRSFDEVRSEIEPEFRRSQVEQAFGDAQEELDTLAFEAGGNIAAVAEKIARPVELIAGFPRSGGGALGASPALVEAVFSPEVLAGRELRTVELAPGRVVAVGVETHVPARVRPLAEVRADVLDGARREESSRLAAQRAAAIADTLKKGALWQKATADWQSGSATHEPKRRERNDAELPAEIRDAAFHAPRPADKPVYGVATLANGDSALWTVTAAEPGRFASLSADDRQLEHDTLRDRVALTETNAYLTSMKASADVDVNPKLFE